MSEAAYEAGGISDAKITQMKVPIGYVSQKRQVRMNELLMVVKSSTKAA